MSKHDIHDLIILLLMPKPNHVVICDMSCNNYYDYMSIVISSIGHIYNLGYN